MPWVARARGAIAALLQSAPPASGPPAQPHGAQQPRPRAGRTPATPARALRAGATSQTAAHAAEAREAGRPAPARAARAPPRAARGPSAPSRLLEGAAHRAGGAAAAGEPQPPGAAAAAAPAAAAAAGGGGAAAAAPAAAAAAGGGGAAAAAPAAAAAAGGGGAAPQPPDDVPPAWLGEDVAAPGGPDAAGGPRAPPAQPPAVEGEPALPEPLPSVEHMLPQLRELAHATRLHAMRFVPRGAEADVARAYAGALVAAVVHQREGPWLLAALARLLLRRGNAATVAERALRAHTRDGLEGLIREAHADIPPAPTTRAQRMRARAKAKRAAALAAAGRAAAAVRACADTSVMSGEEAREAVQALLHTPQNDAAGEHDALPPAAQATRADITRISVAEARALITRVARGGAPGIDGLSADALAAMSGSLPDMAVAFRAFYVAVNTSATDGEWARAVRVCPLKKVTGKARPICIQPLLYRCVARGAVKRAARKVAPELRARGVYGVGTPAAVERVVHQLRRLRAERGGVLFKADVKNAYGSINMAAVAAALRAWAPGLLPLLRYGYGGTVRAYIGDGPPISVTALVQGDPLSALAFSIAVAHALGSTTRPRVRVYLYIDDITGHAVDVEALAEYVAAARAAGVTIGLVLDEEKSQATAAGGGLRAVEGGMVVLGCPLGSDVFVQQCAVAKATKAARVVADIVGMRELPLHTRLWMVCAAGAFPRIALLLRTVPPRLLGEAAQIVDAATERALRIFACLRLDEELHELRHHLWPTRYGGFGGLSARALASAAFLGAALAAQPHLLGARAVDPAERPGGGRAAAVSVRGEQQ